MTNKPTLGGYLELLFKVFITMTVLIFWGVLIAAVAMVVPFMLSLVCVLAFLFLVGRMCGSERSCCCLCSP